jgi:hypothetical protein
MAEKFVKESLKSPSTAKFGSVFGEYQNPNELVSYDSESKVYTVRGWVDSQNGFGAVIRARFKVTMLRVDEDNWRRVGNVELAE